MAVSTSVVGRDEELAAVAGLFGSAEALPRVLMLEGAAGIGKTTLWRTAVDEAGGRGYRVLACAAAGSETQLSFGSLRDLLADAFDEVADGLPAPQRRALAVTLLREDPSGSAPEPAAIAVSFRSALRLLSERAPTLVAVDDVQWLDRASAAVIAYVVRRLEDEQIAVVLARRTDDDEQPWPGLERVDPDIVHVVRPRALSVGAIGRILLDRLGVAYPRPTLARIQAVSGGNPFFALELAQALESSPVPLRPGGSLPVPGTLRNLVRGRLGELLPQTLDALLVASATSRPSHELLEAALGRDPGDVLAPAVAASVIDLDERGLRFAHPLFAATVYDLASPARRREAHRTLANAVSDPEERARHLALATSTPDAAVARLVEDAAAGAFSRGSPTAAAELAAHARRMTPNGDEAGARRRTLAEADYELAAGDTGRASALVDELLAVEPAGQGRADLLNREARIRLFGDDIGESVRLLYEALDQAGGDDALRARIEEGLAWSLLLARKDLPSAAAHARSAAQHAEARAEESALAEALAAQALTECALGGPWQGTMARALSLEEATFGLRVVRHPSFARGYCLICADELAEARRVFVDLRQRALDAGDEGSMPAILNHLALIGCLDGDTRAAARDADVGYELALESGQLPNQASLQAKSALLAARRGHADEACETAWRALETAGGPGFRADAPERAMGRGGETALWTLGFLALTTGDPEKALLYLAPMTAALLRAGIEEPGEYRWLPDEIEALVRLGRFDEADTLTGRLERWGDATSRPSVAALALRCRGLVLAERAQVDAAAAVLEQAAAAHERSTLPFEQARTLLELGSVQRRARRRRDARETLEQAAEIFEALDAGVWTAKARAEQRRIGGRVASSGDLTPAESRVAELVASGKTNREVAGELVVSVHTVEAALTQVYRKLGVRSRTELAHRFFDPPS